MYTELCNVQMMFWCWLLPIQSGQGTYSIAGFDVVVLEDDQAPSGTMGGFTIGLLIVLGVFLLLVCTVVTISVLYRQ